MTLSLLFLGLPRASSGAPGSHMIIELAQMLADHDVAIAWCSGVPDAAPCQQPEKVRQWIAHAVRPDCVVLDADSHTAGALRASVSLVRNSWGTVPVILCGESLHAELLGRTGADALYCGKDSASFLHLLGTFGFRIRMKRRKKRSDDGDRKENSMSACSRQS